MARNQEFYKGSRKKRNYALVPFVIALGVITMIVVLFYGMQKYAVISHDSVSVVLPGMEQEEDTRVDSLGHEVKSFDPVETTLVIDEPDYSRVQATAGRYTRPIRAIFIGADELNHDNLMEKAGRLSEGNALILEMKPRSGALNWASESQLCRSYGLYYENDVTNNITAWLQELRETAEAQDKEIWLAAQISCCIDSLLASRSLDFALRTDYGMDYRDDNGTWMDPYNSQLRNYIVELCRELFEMGFDEVVLADVMHPVPQQENMNFIYSAEMSSTPKPLTAVCGFALYVADQLSDRGRNQVLSIYVNSPKSLVGADESNGQDSVLFFKVYDRVYYNTDMYTFTYNLEDVEYVQSVTIGSTDARFVPVVINYLPKHNSWIYKEDLPDED